MPAHASLSNSRRWPMPAALRDLPELAHSSHRDHRAAVRPAPAANHGHWRRMPRPRLVRRCRGVRLDSNQIQRDPFGTASVKATSNRRDRCAPRHGLMRCRLALRRWRTISTLGVGRKVPVADHRVRRGLVLRQQPLACCDDGQYPATCQQDPFDLTQRRRLTTQPQHAGHRRRP